jgi:hypothetical protein
MDETKRWNCRPGIFISCSLAALLAVSIAFAEDEESQEFSVAVQNEVTAGCG